MSDATRCLYRLILRVRPLRCQKKAGHRGLHRWSSGKSAVVRWLPPKWSSFDAPVTTYIEVKHAR